MKELWSSIGKRSSYTLFQGKAPWKHWITGNSTLGFLYPQSDSPSVYIHLFLSTFMLLHVSTLTSTHFLTYPPTRSSIYFQFTLLKYSPVPKIFQVSLVGSKIIIFFYFLHSLLTEFENGVRVRIHSFTSVDFTVKVHCASYSKNTK